MSPRLVTARRWRWLAGCGVAAMAGASCTSDPAEIEVAITLGYEEGAMSAAPAVTRVTVEARDADGEVVASGEAAPGGELDLGDVGTDAFVQFEVRGVDASGATVLRGRSLGFLAGALDGEALPVFAQRLGSFARPPGGLALGHQGGVATLVAERWLLSTGGARAIDGDGAEGDAASADFYDLFAWDGATAEALPRAAASLVARSTAVLSIDGGGATWFDFDSGETAEATVSGVDFAAIAGGITIEAPDDVSFVVGATRASGAATTAILRVAADGSLTAANLATPRLSAAAAWVDGIGLVVAGGSAEGAGIEVLGTDDEIARTLPFPPSSVTGAGLVFIGESTALRVGGLDGDDPAPTGAFSLTCATDCAIDAFPETSALPGLVGVRAFSTARGVLAIGDDATGATRPFLVPLDRTAVVETPLREARFGAAVTPAPNGTLAVLGGATADGKGATHVEMFFPE